MSCRLLFKEAMEPDNGFACQLKLTTRTSGVPKKLQRAPKELLALLLGFLQATFFMQIGKVMDNFSYILSFGQP